MRRFAAAESPIACDVHQIFVKFSDTPSHVGGFDRWASVQALIGFWSHALCAAAFLGLSIWRVGAIRQPDQRLLLAGFAVTACWAWLSAILPGDPLTAYAETARNLVWIGLLHSLSTTSDERQHGVRWVYFAVAIVIGFQFVVTSLRYFVPLSGLADTINLLRITTAAGALVLVHNLYGQASPASRSNIRLAMLALSLIVELRPQPLHHRLPRQPAHARHPRGARRNRRGHRPDVRDGRPPGRRVARPAVARGDVPVALAACDLRILRADGDPRHGASRDQRRMVARPAGRPSGGDDRRGDGASAERQGPQLGQGEDLEAFVRASLRLSHRMAPLHRNGRQERRIFARRSANA